MTFEKNKMSEWSEVTNKTTLNDDNKKTNVKIVKHYIMKRN